MYSVGRRSLLLTIKISHKTEVIFYMSLETFVSIVYYHIVSKLKSQNLKRVNFIGSYYSNHWHSIIHNRSSSDIEKYNSHLNQTQIMQWFILLNEKHEQPALFYVILMYLVFYYNHFHVWFVFVVVVVVVAFFLPVFFLYLV